MANSNYNVDDFMRGARRFGDAATEWGAATTAATRNGIHKALHTNDKAALGVFMGLFVMVVSIFALTGSALMVSAPEPRSELEKAQAEVRNSYGIFGVVLFSVVIIISIVWMAMAGSANNHHHHKGHRSAATTSASSF
jgi:hypothetical protein